VEGASQVILRNEARLPAGPLLLMNPPRDLLAGQLRRGDRPVRCWTQDRGDFRWLQAAGQQVEFSAVPQLQPTTAAAILFLPREKERLQMLAHAVASAAEAGLCLWVVGENRGGIRSAGRHLKGYFESVRVLDKARHCALLDATRPGPASTFTLDEYRSDWAVEYAGHTIRLCSLPGVFAHRRLDGGSRLLLEALAGLRPRGRVLDFACGCGVLGLAIKSAEPDAQLTLLDSSALALEAARRSLAANALESRVLASDGLEELDGRFDWIVSNPPFHRGVSNDFEVAGSFFRRAGTFLAENGKMVVVFNRHLPYLAWLQDGFRQVERIADGNEFTIALAT